MLTISCPFCGPRSENEFMHGGPARVVRPENPAEYDNQAWINYLTHQPNPVGPTSEIWWHARGCGTWLTIQRDTTTHVIVEPADENRNDTQGGTQGGTHGNPHGDTGGGTQSDNTAS